jgi:multiple sugar transport system ATP-binding protein
MRKTPAPTIASRLAAASAMLGLEPYLQRLPKQLSGGQRQRVAMGRAMVREPAVFLFDEPLSNLDAKLRVQMRTEIKERHQRLRITTIYVTHDQTEAMTLADRIVVMNDGRIEQIGAPLALYNEPQNTFVATFIGSPAMNLLPGRVVGGAFETAGGTRLPLPGRQSPNIGTALYGIRPEHISPASGGVPATVEVVEPTGADLQLVLRLDQATTIRAAFRDFGRGLPEVGEKLAVSPATDRIHLFSGEGGQVLH